MPQNLLICEDDPTQAEVLRCLLGGRGYRVSVVATGAEALAAIAHEAPALLLLDLNLPDMDGLDVCRRLRAGFPQPIIMMSGRGAELDRVLGLELGADAYLVKPFGLEELAARVAAQLRRAGQYAPGERVPTVRRIGELTLDLEGRRLLRCGAEVPLTPKEFDLLAALAAQPGVVVRSGQLLREVWGYSGSIRTRTLDVHVGRLRAKLETDTRRPRYLLTVPGLGYKLCAPEVVAA